MIQPHTLELDALKSTAKENASSSPSHEANVESLRAAESREEVMRVKLMAAEDVLKQQTAELMLMTEQAETAEIRGTQQVEDRVLALTQELKRVQTELDVTTEKLSVVLMERDTALQQCSSHSIVVAGLQEQLNELQQLRLEEETEQETQLQEVIETRDAVHAKALSKLSRDLDVALGHLAEEKRIREAMQDSQTRQAADQMVNYITIDAHMIAMKELQNQLNEKEAMSRLAEENRMREITLQDSRPPSLPPVPHR